MERERERERKETEIGGMDGCALRLLEIKAAKSNWNCLKIIEKTRYPREKKIINPKVFNPKVYINFFRKVKTLIAIEATT